MIPDFKTYITESIWGDIRKRSVGETIRKEDDINRFDRDAMFGYIYSIYKQNSNVNAIALKNSTKEGESFSIPIFIYFNALYRLCVQYDNDKVNKIQLLATKKDCEGFYENIENKFDIIELSNGSLLIRSKELTLSNELVIDVIETINDGIKNTKTHNRLEPMLIKKEN